MYVQSFIRCQGISSACDIVRFCGLGILLYCRTCKCLFIQLDLKKNASYTRVEIKEPTQRTVSWIQKHNILSTRKEVSGKQPVAGI